MNDVKIMPFFATSVLQIQLNLNLERLSTLAFEMMIEEEKGVQKTNRGGWQSKDINKKHEELEKLKTEINQYLQIYHSEVFRESEMKFGKNLPELNIINMWLNINNKNHWNEWHVHPYCTLSGAYYVKHDGSSENGDIIFKNKHETNMLYAYPLFEYYPHYARFLDRTYEITEEIVRIIPKSNMLLIFPSWLDHKVEINLKNNSRISFSFNAKPI